MAAHSAGILLYRRTPRGAEVFCVHPGGPFWKNRSTHAWSLPKGEFDPEKESPEHAARREFFEETGLAPPESLVSLGQARQSGGKTVHAFAGQGDADSATLRSNTFSMEWPPRSGKTQEFPEVDRAAWFTLDTAREKLHKGQSAFLGRLEEILGEG